LNYEINILTDFENENSNDIESQNLNLIDLIKNKFNEQKLFHDKIINSNFEFWSITNNEDI